jgi:nucleoside-diphosphate-sugar epimerase
VHLANHPHDGARDPQTLYRENVSMTMNLVQAAVESGIKKVIYASSIQAMMFYFNHWHSDIRVSGCSIPYLPADGDMPANPGSSYGLSKQACEEMLRYFSKKHGLNSVALRFPWLVEEKWLSHIRSSTEREIPRCVNLDECMSFLSCADAARLIKAILDTDLTGFRIYLPASKDIKFHYPVPELVKELYPGVPLRKPVETLRSLVDISRITGETGWVPRDNLTADQ